MGLPNWNPNSPGKRGIELLDTGYSHNTIDAAADVGELQWTSGYTGPVDTIDLFAGSGASAALTSSGYNALSRPVYMELVNQGSEAWGALAFDDFTVTAVTGSSGIFNENLTTPLNPNRLNTTNDGLYAVSSKLNATIDAQFSTGAYSLARHILAVEVIWRGNITLRVGRFDPGGQLWAHDFPFWTSSWATGVMRFGEAIVEFGGSAWKHWTPQMIRDFASGGTRKIRITCRAGPGAWALDRLQLRVYSIPERRRAVGFGSPTTSQAWTSFAMQTPPATGAPAIASGDQLTLIVRRITDYSIDAVASAVMPWRYMRGRSPDGNWRQHAQPFNPTVSSSAAGQANLMGPAGAQIDGIPAARLKASGTVVSDTMPYSLSRGGLAYGANVVSQFLTMPGGGTLYGQTFVVAGWIPGDGRPIAPLRAEVYLVSTGVKVMDAVEITAADVDRLPVSAPSNNNDDQGAIYKTVQLRFPASLTLAAAQYELRYSSPGSTAARPWRIAALIADAHTTDQTFRGSTDFAAGLYSTGNTTAALTSGGVRSSDLLAQLVEVPGPVTGTGSSVGSLTANHLELCDPNVGCEGCADETLPFATITWSPAVSGSPDVAAYQVDRMDDLSPDWERVAYVVGRTTARWDDIEVRIGVKSSYRIRVVRTDGVTGDWSAPVTVTIPVGQVALSFSSNAAAGMGCVYPEVWQGEITREWAFLEAGDVELRRMFGRNRQVAFRPLERRGDQFTRTILLNALCAVTLPSMATYSPLRDLAWAPIPYVCVRDGEGNRWYASLTVPGGINRRADTGDTTMWLADIGIAEIADTPAVHDTSVPQVEQVASL